MVVRRYGIWGRVALYLLLTFALSWGFDLAITLTTGHVAFLELGLAPWSMFVPAAVAFALQIFVFSDSSIHISRYRGRPLLLPISFLGLTLLYGLITALVVAWPGQRTLFGGLGNLLTTLWTLLLFGLVGQVGGQGLGRLGLPLGDRGRGLKIAVGVVAFLLLQFALNRLFGLGDFRGNQETLYGIGVPRALYPVGLALAFTLTVSGIPLSGLAATFGEECGWRGVLQDAWLPFGRRRAVLMVGLVWGIWHFPPILGGVHTYPATLTCLLLALLLFVLWGFVQSYAVLKTGSIWVAAFLHGLVNSVYAFGLSYLVRPEDKVWSFGLGIYGLLSLVPIVLFLLRDPIWDNSDLAAQRPTKMENRTDQLLARRPEAQRRG